ncbi:hypothetical protein PsorP6_011886 [Peronosclerospora sorghi]|uniref:Uncharacterized protein n=1 Tax=Peronosclerospora sorghi TaxID=230839 RepID=A0ACC0WL77_9STRA|nr:hypothetical protein PsorP6_011886 [Peronosclerospora sorghi]
MAFLRKNGLPLLVGAVGAASLEQNGVETDTFHVRLLGPYGVVRKEYPNAVCFVRPPGHHVGTERRAQVKVTLARSMICYLNAWFRQALSI